MTFQWDPEKARINIAKHGISFADAVSVLSDDRALTIEEDYPDEQRFITLGMDTLGKILVVVYAWRGDDIRIISARKAIPREQKRYEENL
jgi:hypothetical protein